MRTIKRDIVGAFIISFDNKLLIGKTGVYENQWVIPGGGIEPGETKKQALQREVFEETGIDISAASLEEFNDVIRGSSQKKLRDTNEIVLVEMNFYNFVVKLIQPASDIQLKVGDDFSNAKWVDIHKLAKIKLSPPTIISLKKLGYL